MSDIREKIGVAARTHEVAEILGDQPYAVVSVDENGDMTTHETHETWVDAQLAADKLNADAILAIIEAEHRIVPREPTEEMIEAAKNTVRAWAAGCAGYSPMERLYTTIYHAQLDAAPKVTK